MWLKKVYVVFLIFSSYIHASQIDDEDLLIIALRDKETDGFSRMLSSANRLQLKVKVLDIPGSIKCETTRRGEHENTCQREDVPIQNTKLTIVRKEIETYKNEKKKVIAILDTTESYSILFNGDKQGILQEFFKLKASIVLSSLSSPIENQTEAENQESQKQRTNIDVGGLIGYASDLHKVLTRHKPEQNKDYQLQFTDIYLNEELREAYSMKLDEESSIFHNWNKYSNIKMKISNDHYYLNHRTTDSSPGIIRGNMDVSGEMNKASDYIGKAYDLKTGCKECKENVIDIRGVKDEDLPMVLVGVFIEQPTPFFEEFLIDLDNLNYPKQKIHLYVYINHQYNKEQLEEYIDKREHEYKTIKYIKAEENMEETEARQYAVQLCLERRCDYYFSLDATAHLDNSDTLKLLIEQNRSILAPLLFHPTSKISNILTGSPKANSQRGFHKGDNLEKTARISLPSTSKEDNPFTEGGFLKQNLTGVWNVPYISAAYVVKASVLKANKHERIYQRNGTRGNNSVSAFCKNMRMKGIFMHVTNQAEFGHLVRAKTFNSSLLHSEMYEAISNRWDWEKRYIVHNHTQYLNGTITIEQPCQDVFWFPVTTPRYCKELLEIAKAYNKWGDDKPVDVPAVPMKKSVDRRIAPTKDDYDLSSDPKIEPFFAAPKRGPHIPMKALGLKESWLVVLREFVHPVAERTYKGYYATYIDTFADYVLQFSSDEQPELKPRHDRSIYSVHMGLNSPIQNYEGGGMRFLRYKCNVTTHRVGWALLYPGKLTHYHQALPITRGKRYSLVSFVNPPH